MFDSRIFEDGNNSHEPNIEFHIHAFLSPNSIGSPLAARGQEVGVGPASEENLPVRAPVALPIPQQSIPERNVVNTETQTSDHTSPLMHPARRIVPRVIR